VLVEASAWPFLSHLPRTARIVCSLLRLASLCTGGGSFERRWEGDIRGSIEVGKVADLAVWGEDPYTALVQRLWQIPIEMTLVGGEIVHQCGNISLLPRRARDLWS
jgi:hypothetical protein